MTTATETLTEQAVDPNIGDRFIATDYLDAPDEERQPRTSLPTPGFYFVRCDKATPEFDAGRTGTSDDGFEWAVPPNIKVALQFSIVSTEDGDATLAGTALNKFYEITSLPVRMGKSTKNWSELSAALDAFGLAMPKGTDATAENIMAICQQMEGLTTTRAIHVSLVGKVPKGYKTPSLRSYKDYFKQGDGTYKNLNEAAFRRDQTFEGSERQYVEQGGTYAAVGYILDPTEAPVWTLQRPSENSAHAVVFARVEPLPKFGWKKRG